MNILFHNGIMGYMVQFSTRFNLYSAVIFAAGNDYLLAIGAPLGVIASAYFGWLVAKRTTSGNIQTSEAKDLWASYGKLVSAGDKLREELSNEVRALRDENNQLREQLLQQTEQLSQAFTRIRELETQVRELKKGNS